jgi:hypothetical protein
MPLLHVDAVLSPLQGGSVSAEAEFYDAAGALIHRLTTDALLRDNEHNPAPPTPPGS